jgi:hypothetical protein
MNLRFLSDDCVPFETSGTLRQHGHDVTLLRDVMPVRSPDPLVIAMAQTLGTLFACRVCPTCRQRAQSVMSPTTLARPATISIAKHL